MIIGQPFIAGQQRTLLDAFRRRRYRTMEQFARDEIVITKGPYPGRFLPERQPHMLHWYRLVDSGLFSELLATGPSQSGKTLNCWVVPMLYHLFEIGETVIAAVPDTDMISDKWTEDIFPVIESSRYRDLLPTIGKGSKGGIGMAIKFRNGATLRWMTAGGDDKRRAHFTARVICMTETDGFDVSSETSAEGTKLEQVEARARSFAESRRRIYKECTVSLKEKHTWHTYENRSTSTRLLMPCPACGEWVLPERDNLCGWKGADSDELARQGGHFVCPECSAAWTEHQRRKGVQACVAVHKGQHITSCGEIVGEMQPTRTLGFRWSAVHNMLLPAGDIAADEWRAERASDEDAKQRAMCQFVWAIPYAPLDIEQDDLEPAHVERRAVGLGRGQKPDNAWKVAVGIDVNKPVLHWTATAFFQDGSARIIDYGKTGIRWRESGFNKALADAIVKLRDTIHDGWSDDKIDRFNIDARAFTDDVISAVKALKDRRWRVHMGLGKGQYLSTNYYEAESPEHDKKLVWVGERTYEKVVTKHGAIIQYADANHWKAKLQELLAIDAETGSITLFSGAEGTHTQFARHITAERETEEFEPKRGVVKVFKQLRSANHWLDSTCLSLTGGHRLGWRSKRQTTAGPEAPTQPMQADPGYSVPEYTANYEGYEGYQYGRE